MKYKDIPNIITIIRFILIIPVVVALIAHEHTTAFIVFLIAGASDALDGLLARKFNWMTRLGSIIDPLADKTLLICCFIVLAFLGHIPAYVTWLVVGRDLIIVAGGWAYHHLVGPFDLVPTYLSKVNTFVQIMFISLMLFQLAFNTLPAALLNVLIYVVLLTTTLSFIDYVWSWGRQAIRARSAVQ